MLTGGKLHADDMPMQVLLPGNKKTKTERLWTYVRDDRNAGFNELYREGRIREAACRVPPAERSTMCTSALTEESLRQSGQLYTIEADIRGMPAEQRLAERQRKTKPLLSALESWLCEKMKNLSRHSELTKAFVDSPCGA